MPWRFVDRQGREGWVREDLSVDYSGEEGIAELVEKYADEVENEDEPPGDLLQRVMIRLYTAGAVREIEQSDDGAEGVRGRSPAADRSARADRERSE